MAHNYAACVTNVNVENVAAARHFSSMAQNIVSHGVSLRRLMIRAELTMAELATAMGYRAASSVQRYLMDSYGEHGPLPLKVATRFAKVLVGKGKPPIEADEIFGMAGVELTSNGTFRPTDIAAFFNPGVMEPTRAFAPPLAVLDLGNKSQMAPDLPVFGTALGCEQELLGESGAPLHVEHAIIDTSEPIDYLRRPAGLVGRKDVFACYVVGESMSPRFEDGEPIIVDPRRPATPSDDVLVQLVDASGQDGDDRVTVALVKRLVRRSASHVTLRQFNPPMDFTIDRRHIASMFRVMAPRDFLAL